jgi:membrane-bound serine protease (ClpP class)
MPLLATVPAAAATTGSGVDVVDVAGPLDQRMLDFMADAIEDSDAALVVIQVDSPGISSGDPARLLALVEDPPVPLAVWVGPDPAVALGGVATILNHAPIRAAAPGVRIGYRAPTVLTGPDVGFTTIMPAGGEGVEDGALAERTVVVGTDAIPGFVDFAVPSIGQLVVGLDGAVVEVGGETVTLSTAEQVVDESGTAVLRPAAGVTFIKPGLSTRFLRLGSTPGSLYFFLLAGIAAAAFEFYAAGVGLTALVAAVSLFIAGYGVATMPVDWVAVAAALVGMAAYTSDFQRNQLGIPSVAGTGLLVFGGMTLTNASPQYGSSWWLVIAIVAGVALFYGFALTTVVRARFSTRTIGREYLVGRRGEALSVFDPEGTVVLDGARWRARSHRAAGIRPGDPIEVLEVNGIVLEVGPVDEEPHDTQGIHSSTERDVRE